MGFRMVPCHASTDFRESFSLPKVYGIYNNNNRTSNNYNNYSNSELVHQLVR